MKQFILPVIFLCAILLVPAYIIAEETPENQIDSSTNLNTNLNIDTRQKSESHEIPGVESDNITKPVSSETKETVKAEHQKDSDVFDLDKYVEETKKKLEELDFKKDVLEKCKNPETGNYNLENTLNTADAILDEFAPGRSPLAIVLKPSHVFEKVKFACPGDYQFRGVYYIDRDLNGYNGDQFEYSEYWKKDMRVMTNEVEAFFYHDLILRPRFEFANGLINLHTEFKHGGYVWEMALPNYRFEDEVIYGANAQQTEVDTTQLAMTALALEMVLPGGYVMLGRLPDPMQGLTGIAMGLPLPPVGGFLGGVGFLYGKVLEGMIWDDERKRWEGHGWDYLEVNNSDGYKDDDDCTIYAAGLGGMMPALGGTVYAAGAGMMIIGGDESMLFSGMELNIAGGYLGYHRGTFKLNTLTACAFGQFLDLSTDTWAGSLIDKFSTLYFEAIDAMDFGETKYRRGTFFESLPEIAKIDPTFLIASHASMDVGNFTPEACVIYGQGAEEPWKMPMLIPGEVIQSKGNKTPQGMLKSYLLNEVERKYMYLIGTVPISLVHLGLRSMDLFSTNLTALKAGSAYRISKHFSLYGQAVAAWRTDVEYYKKDYWDNYIMTKNFKEIELYTNDERIREIQATAIFQLNRVDYYEDEIDNFLGVELDGQLTYHVREGLDISLIGAYFKTGGFYEDILTPKEYSSLIGLISDIDGRVGFASEDEEVLYGPYEACRFFKSTDAYTVQVHVDLKWD